MGFVLDNYEFFDDGVVLLCVASVSVVERAGWTTIVDEFLVSFFVDDIVVVDVFVDCVYFILVLV